MTAPKAKLTATYQGVTATRRTNHVYTHVVFALVSGELEAREQEKGVESTKRDIALTQRALDMIARGEVPAKGDALLESTSGNYYHKFTRWDNVARETLDAGRSFRDLTHDEAVAQQAKYTANYADYFARVAKYAAELRAKGDRWVAISWHHSHDLAVKGVEAARSYSCRIGFATVEVSK